MAMKFITQVFQGKTLNRILFNREVERHSRNLAGKALDLGGGSGRYLPLLPSSLEVVRTDRYESEGVIAADFNKPLPFGNETFDHAFFFNALYIADEPEKVLHEIGRVLKAGGKLLITSPFLQNEMREPHDYQRFTSEGLERLCRASGFAQYEISPYGERFSVAANLLHPFWYFSLARVPIYALALLLDACVPKRVRMGHPAPLGYFIVLTKKHRE